MMIEIPLPTPRFVICSPIHMRSAVPAVRVETISNTRPTLKFGIAAPFPVELVRFLNRKA